MAGTPCSRLPQLNGKLTFKNPCCCSSSSRPFHPIALKPPFFGINVFTFSCVRARLSSFHEACKVITPTHAHTHTYTHTRIHTHTHTRKQTRTHTRKLTSLKFPSPTLKAAFSSVGVWSYFGFNKDVLIECCGSVVYYDYLLFLLTCCTLGKHKYVLQKKFR